MTLLPAIIQDQSSGQVLMLGYMNTEALQKTQDTGYVHFFSRKRRQLWLKGATSGNKLKVKQVYLDCDQDTYLIIVDLVGTHVCHLGTVSCFTHEPT